ncbi:MAG TPA: hypothetical protein VGI84_02450 [Pseudonocardiaceae bacterium]
MDPGSADRTQGLLSTDAAQLRAAAARLALSVARVATEVATGRARMAASYRRIAQRHPSRGAYYLQRAREMDGLAARARAFAEREAHEARSLASAPDTGPAPRHRPPSGTDRPA